MRKLYVKCTVHWVVAEFSNSNLIENFGITQRMYPGLMTLFHFQGEYLIMCH